MLVSRSPLCREELPTIVAGDSNLDDGPRPHRTREANPGEMFSAAGLAGLDQYLAPCANLRLEVTA